MYDLIVLGGGPAGLTAAVYGIRKRLEVLLISPDLVTCSLSLATN
jgi:alkyl hydroperoxide reductase subunit F